MRTCFYKVAFRALSFNGNRQISNREGSKQSITLRLSYIRSTATGVICGDALEWTVCFSVRCLAMHPYEINQNTIPRYFFAY